MTLWKTFMKSSLSVVIPKGKQCLSSKTLLGGVRTHTIMLHQVFIIPLYCVCLVFLFCLFLFCADISDFSPVGFTFNFALNFPGHFGFHNCTKANRLEPPALLILNSYSSRTRRIWADIYNQRGRRPSWLLSAHIRQVREE